MSATGIFFFALKGRRGCQIVKGSSKENAGGDSCLGLVIKGANKKGHQIREEKTKTM